MTPAEIAERYARYKMMREAPFTGWARSEVERDSVSAKKQKKVIDLAKDKLEARVATDSTQALLAEYDTVTKLKTELGKLKKERNFDAYRQGMQDLYQSHNMVIMSRIRRYKRDIKELTEKYLRATTSRELDSINSLMMRTRDNMLQDVRNYEAQ